MARKSRKLNYIAFLSGYSKHIKLIKINKTYTGILLTTVLMKYILFILSSLVFWCSLFCNRDTRVPYLDYGDGGMKCKLENGKKLKK